MKNILVTSNKYPDMDGVACAIAYNNYLLKVKPENKYTVKFSEGIHIEPRFVLDNLNLPIDLLENENYEEYILVDTSAKEGLNKDIDLKKITEIIDHRLVPQYEDFPNAKFRIEPVGAAATQIAEFFYFDNVNLSSVDAQLLLCAIYSNTINFKSDTTTMRDFRMKKWLETKVEDKELYKKMFDYKTQYTIDNLQEVLKSDLYPVNLKKLGKTGIFQLEMNNTEEIMKRKNDLNEMLRNLSKDTKYNFLIFQNITDGITSVYTKDKEIFELFKELNIEGKQFEDLWIVDHIMMRKSFLKIIKE